MPISKQLTFQLPYFADSSALFSSIAGHPWSVFLDSGYPGCSPGRYEIIATDPICPLVTQGGITKVTRNHETVTSSADPFDLVKEQLIADFISEDNYPFNGGAIGYFSYDLARRLETLPVIAKDA